jgi:molybdopterin/thiamine biosynthesis adenylyltransferase
MNNTDFFNFVQNSNILTDVTEMLLPTFTKRGLVLGVAGFIHLEERLVHICVGATARFPEKELEFFFLNQSEFDILPHVEDNGFICYTNDDNLVLDIDNPCGIIKESFELVRKVLIDGFRKSNEADFYNEYEAYWRRLKSTVSVFANISVNESVTLLKYTKIKDTSNFFSTNDQTECLASYTRFLGSKDKPSYHNGIYIPLLFGSKLTIPRSGDLMDISLVRQIIDQHVSQENQKKIRSLLSKTKADDLIIFSLPQPNGYYSLFGVRLKGISHNTHPLLNTATEVNIIPFTVTRLDSEFMLNRGGTGQSFINKNVLVIGAGSVGSAICEEVIKAGIINLSVIDKDILLPENCYRHNCGFRYVNKKKAEAVKLKLESYYPHAEVKAYSLSIENILEQKGINFQDYNAIIIATGNANTNQYLNKLFKEKFKGIPVLFSWLDPFGIGGHCLVSNISDQGCYQCLYSNISLHNIASFAAPIQHKSFSKSISGCGSMYVPYGSLDALQTAILTIRKLLDVLLGEETKNSIFSWKGNPKMFLSEGYKLSPRFLQNEQQLLISKDLFYQEKCIVCGNK